MPSITKRLRPEQTEVDYIIDHLTVSRGGKGQARLANTLNVTFRHTSDEDCERILRQIIQSYTEYLGHKFHDVSEEAVHLIAEAKDELAKDLEDTEIEYKTFRQNAPLLWNGHESTNVHRLNVERIQEASSNAHVQSASTRTRLEIVEQGIATRKELEDDLKLLALMDGNDLQRLELLVNVNRGARGHRNVSEPGSAIGGSLTHRIRRGSSVSEEASLLLDFGPEHPSVIAVRKHIAKTRDFIDAKTTNVGPRDSRTKLQPAKVLAPTLIYSRATCDPSIADKLN